MIARGAEEAAAAAAAGGAEAEGEAAAAGGAEAEGETEGDENLVGLIMGNYLDLISAQYRQLSD